MSNIYNLLPLQRKIDQLNQKLGSYADDERALKIKQDELERQIKAIQHCRKGLLKRRNALSEAMSVLKEFEEGKAE